MNSVTRPSGVVLELDPGLVLAEAETAPHAPAARGVLLSDGPASVSGSLGGNALVAGSMDQKLAIVDSFDLEGRGGVRVGLDLNGDEVAMVLLERDGTYTSIYPEDAARPTGRELLSSGPIRERC